MHIVPLALAHIALFLFIMYGFGEFQEAMFHAEEMHVVAWMLLIMFAYIASGEIYYHFRKYYRFVSLQEQRKKARGQVSTSAVTEVHSTTHASGFTLHSTSVRISDEDDVGA